MREKYEPPADLMLVKKEQYYTSKLNQKQNRLVSITTQKGIDS